MRRPKRLVILDTNLIDSDKRLSGKWLAALLAASKSDDCDITLAIPEVVILELQAHQERSARQAIASLVKASKQLNMSGAGDESVFDYPFHDAKAVALQYTDWLRKVIDGANGQVVPLPEEGHATLLDRDLSGRKPFAESGKGYRDALIWHSVLDCLGEDESVAFCSDNWRDFFADDGTDPELHPQLAAELTDSQADALSVYRSIEAALTDHVAGIGDDVLTWTYTTNQETGLVEATRRIQEVLSDPAARRRFEQELVELVESSLETPVTIMSPANLDSISLDSIRVTHIDVERVYYEESKGSYAASFLALADANVEYSLSHFDRDGDGRSWSDISETELELPFKAVLSATNVLGEIDLDTSTEWAVVEDFEPIS